MIVVVTGVVGLDKKSYLEKVCELAKQRGRQIQLFNVGDMMYNEAPDVRAGKILDIPLRRLQTLRRSTFKDIIANAPSTKDCIINTHATFRWRHGLFPAVDFDQMRQINADMYICLIDGVADLHARLVGDNFTEHSLKDLIVWREEEIICTELLCKGINDIIPFYCLALGEEQDTTEMFYRLVFEQKRKKAYLSFPMTAVVDMKHVRDEINNFRRQMKEQFICFDPGDLEEAYLPIYARRAKEQGKSSFAIKGVGEKIELDTEQVLQIEKDINSQTYARDFLLIEQADMIISFIPTTADGRAAIASGVERELQHAHESAKEVFVIWPAKQRPSVFVTQTATKIFPDIQSALGFLVG
jgi:adenylate kinase